MTLLAMLLLVGGQVAVESTLPAVPSLAPRRVELDAGFAYGFGARHAFGGVTSAAMVWRVCDAPALDCGLRLGAFAGYQNEPFGLTAHLFAPAVIDGHASRVELFGSVGFSARFFRARRLLFEIDAFAGWTGLWLAGRLRYAELGVDRSTRGEAHEFTFGFVYTLGIRLSDRVSLLGRVTLPIPYRGVAISSYFMTSLGLRMAL